MQAGTRKEGGTRIRKADRQPESGAPLISLITVAYNAAATIEDTIRSVLSQTYTNVEYIIIDGGSRDGTSGILDKYDDRVDYWLSEKDGGIYDAMNKGIAMASGDVVGFLNADDYFADESVLEQVAGVFRHESIDACYADLIYVSSDNRRALRYWKSKPFSKGAFGAGWCPAHPTFYVRKSVIDRYGSFDQSFLLAADAELMMRYLERNGVRAEYIPQVWVKMRTGGQTNQSWRNILQQNREILAALEKNHIPFSKSRFVANKISNRIRQFIAGRLGLHQ